jgi:hypothetical protein
MMKQSSSAPPARQASHKSSSHTAGFVSPVYLVMLVGGQKRGGNGTFWMRRPKARGLGPSRLGSSCRPDRTISHLAWEVPPRAPP